jgi:hypothetical protein
VPFVVFVSISEGTELDSKNICHGGMETSIITVFNMQDCSEEDPNTSDP